MTILRLLSIALLLFAGNVAHGERCRDVELVVFGSGGPELDDGRASSAYAILHAGRARVLVDAGPGAAVAFDRAGLAFADVRALLLTHLHVDHSADLPAFVKGGYFTERERALPVLGPAGNDRMPGTRAFVRALFTAGEGPWRYLADHLPDGTAAFTLAPRAIAPEGRNEMVLDEPGLRVRAANVRHGPIPALAWRVEVGGCPIAFSGDMNARSGHLEALAAGAALLVAHAAIPEGTTGAARDLHMPPSEIGRIAAEAEVPRLVLSHFMRRSLARLDDVRETIEARYDGVVIIAEDGLRLRVDPASASQAWDAEERAGGRP